MANTGDRGALRAHAVSSRSRKSQIADSQEYEKSRTSAASSHNSQSTVDGLEGASTPPTSEGLSSQSTNPEGQLPQLSQLSQLPAAQPPMSSTDDAGQNTALAAGQKRMADGQVKQLSNLPKSHSMHGGHSRTTSNVSNASTATKSVGELSSELQTRLSYYMVKVNNGWQSKSIDEVESLASQAASPTSSTSTLPNRRNHIASSRSTMAQLQGNTPRQTFATAPTGDFDLYSRTDAPVQRTYESFWREHPTSMVSQQRQHRTPTITPPPSKAPLAPPPDIRPTPHSRRSESKNSKPTMPSSTPRTPGRPLDIQEARIQTPSQKTIQEQDAIETLLFMSSPGNSQNIGPAHATRPHAASPPQASPLRAEIRQQPPSKPIPGGLGRKLGFERVAKDYSTGRKALNAKSGDKKKASLEKLLDEMEDPSSDEDEVLLSYSDVNTRRVTAGRV